MGALVEQAEECATVARAKVILSTMLTSGVDRVPVVCVVGEEADVEGEVAVMEIGIKGTVSDDEVGMADPNKDDDKFCRASAMASIITLQSGD